ncbi:Arginine/serine-rich coiled-coil protein 2 [Armadillidium nasatum]|uniref:Arginine/serine-rich coiled-coil protein 2 n=1 Tax=Armadillidium nasatum TaxID=96803 RepID=A0A5N5TE56_9CRUS|nr:Arginine/serine-rich coiled-coil protein 2 [Armadillidium nasatum]
MMMLVWISVRTFPQESGDDSDDGESKIDETTNGNTSKGNKHVMDKGGTISPVEGDKDDNSRISLESTKDAEKKSYVTDQTKEKSRVREEQTNSRHSNLKVKRSRSRSRERHRSNRSRSRERTGKDVKEPSRDHRDSRRLDSSREHRRLSRNDERRSSRRSRSRSRERRRSRSRSRSRDRERRKRRTRSRTHSRSRSRSRDRDRKRPHEIRREAQQKLAAFKASNPNFDHNEMLKKGMEAQFAEVQKNTGVTLPTYYNPAIMNPIKIAEQERKKKLLWGNKNKVEAATAEPTGHSTGIWVNTKFSNDTDGKMAEKFKRLMGVKNAAAAGSATPMSSSSNSPSVPEKGKDSNEILQKQEVLFDSMEKQYEMARLATHTQRGYGLGFSSQSYFPK